jgi:hypothetical protein
MHPAIKAELDNLKLQYGSKSMLTLDEYAELYGIKRGQASQHLRRKKIPFVKEGKFIYIMILDLATYRAQRKQRGNAPLASPFQNQADEMKRRRGFNQIKERKQLAGEA